MTARHPGSGWGGPGEAAANEYELARARLVLDQVPGGVLVLDDTGRVVYVNGIAELRLDVSRGELLDRDLFSDVLPELEEEGVGTRYREAMKVGRVSLAAEVSLETGRGRAQLGLGMRALALEGSLWGLVLVEDRSGLAAERSRRRRAERLAAVGELATGVAHEINNPLATIRGFTQLLARDAEGGEQEQALEIIEVECGRIARTIQNLQQFVRRQESGEKGPIDLSVLVEEVVTLKRYALETAGIQVELELVPDPSPIHGEPDAVQRVVLSLLGNAEEVLQERSSDRRLIVRTRESTDGVVLYVIDNGPGVPREQLPALLSTPLPGREDLPLGLDVAASLAREQGAQIWADSAEGHGTAFFVRFPRLTEAAAEREPAEGEEEPAMPARARRLRVLVADDESALRMAISLFLSREDHQVVEAPDAAQALRLAREQPFDVAVIDIRMPGDGLALLDALEEIPGLRDRTILMTSDATHPRVRSRLGSAQPALIKPFDMAEVVRLVEDVARDR
jgi:signal transduction histidine kinase